MEGVVYPRRGEVYWANLDPAVGSEMTKTRPVVIISNDLGNRFSRRVTIAPFTSVHLEVVYPFEVRVARGEAGLDRDSKVALDQIRAVDKRRIGRRLGHLSTQRMQLVDRAIRISLAV